VPMLRPACFTAAVCGLLQDARTQAVMTPTAPNVATRPPSGMVPSWTLAYWDAARAENRDGYFKMLTARATTRMATTREMASSAIIMSFIQGLTADTSVGLNAVAVAKAKWK
jgi:hypothetical protein